MPRARVLAVDDQRYFRELMDTMLSEEGYDVRTVSGGVEALHALEREHFDIVVTDVMMPEMDGTQLIERIKQLLPQQDVVMVTGVEGVNTVVRAMQLGAADYILKPFERETLAQSIDAVLQRRRVQEEQERTAVENAEDTGSLPLYERALGLFSTLSLEPLAERLAEGLCLETLAQGVVVWIAQDLDESEFHLVAARGLVRLDNEPEVLDAKRLGPDFRALLEEGFPLVMPRSRTRAGSETGGDTQVLYLAMRHAGRTIGIARLADKLEGVEFDESDVAAAEKFVALGAQACANALRFRSLERGSFLDPATQAYTHAYLEDAVRKEIQKADRFGRPFSIVRVETTGLAELRQSLPRKQLTDWLESLAREIGSALRATDILAAENERRFSVLLPETDAVGAAHLKRRIRQTIQASGVLEELEVEPQPGVDLSAATYNTDGTRLESLEQVLETRIEEERQSLLRDLDLDGKTFAHAIESLLELAEPERPEMSLQITRFLLEEVGRRPREHGLLFLSPGKRLLPVVREGLEKLGFDEVCTKIVVVAEEQESSANCSAVSFLSSRHIDSDQPFLLYYGDGPAYALVSDTAGHSMFHTADRALVEHLALQLQRDLGIPLGSWAGAA